MTKLNLISWNVNGLRAALRKGFKEFLDAENPDIICLQETKAQKNQVMVDFVNYEEIWNSAARKGYSGTAIFTKIKPLSISYGLQFDGKIPDEIEDHYGGKDDNEGRVITLDFEHFFLVTVYTPNSKRDLSRLKYRHTVWDPIFLKYVKELEKTKPVIFCGDLNVAHTEIDLARPNDNHKNAGFTDEEREGFQNIVDSGFIDTFRMFNKEGGNYTWWSNFSKARERNIGWRIDYFCVSKALKKNVKSAHILANVMGSDHCPVKIELEI